MPKTSRFLMEVEFIVMVKVSIVWLCHKERPRRIGGLSYRAIVWTLVLTFDGKECFLKLPRRKNPVGFQFF